MTATSFSSSSVHAVKQWTKRMYYDSTADETLPGTLKKYGILKTEDVLTRNAGDNVKISFLKRQSGKGQRGMAGLGVQHHRFEFGLEIHQNQLALFNIDQHFKILFLVALIVAGAARQTVKI